MTIFQGGSIITVRIIMIISASITSKIGSYYQIWPCAKLDWTLGGQNKTLATYPSCRPFYDGSRPNAVASVRADLNNGGPEQSGAALGLNFGMGVWLALFIHAIGVEIYVSSGDQPCLCLVLLTETEKIRLTPAESARLRQISYERQLEGGFRHPGNAGTTVERLGDCDGKVRFAREKPQQVRQDTERSPSRETPIVAES
jgi:hypothetical protein